VWPFTRVIDEITEDDLRALVPELRENRRLDYKAKAYDRDKNHEILKDVSSFANAAGGWLLVGVTEDPNADDGTPLDVVGIDNADVEHNRITQVCHASIRPPIVGIRAREIPLASGKSVVAVSVPDSGNKPHMICHERLTGFYMRHERENLPMEVHEIRETVLRSHDAGRAMFEYLEERRREVDVFAKQNVNSGVPLILWMYAAPPYIGEERIDVITQEAYEFLECPPQQQGLAGLLGHHVSGGVVPTLEGIMRTAPVASAPKVMRMHRTGYLDCADADTVYEGADGTRVLKRESIAAAVYWWTRAAYDFSRKFLDGGEMVLGTALLNASNTVIRFSAELNEGTVQKRKNVNVPALRLTSELDWRLASRHIVDRVHNAYGVPSSQLFHREGTLSAVAANSPVGGRPDAIVAW